MKQATAILSLITITGMACITGKNKISYEFPPEMKPEIRDQYVKQVEKGRILYDISCAKCHNTKVRGRVVIPDFTQEQLIGYEFRIKNQKHENNLTEETVNAEELGNIVTFLTYKKKNKAR